MGDEKQAYIAIANWDELQHYKKRNPPWIKLYNRLLDSHRWGCLQDASKAHYVGLLMLASREENEIPLDVDWVAGRIAARTPLDLRPLVSAGLIEVYHRDRQPLAQSEQDKSEMLGLRDRGRDRGEGSEGSSLRSSPSGAEPCVENPSEDDGGPDGEDEPDPPPEKRKNPWGPTVTACQEHLWLDDDPPGDISRGQELSCAGQICDRWNLDPPEMPTLLEGFARLRDRGFWGEWVEPEEPASLRALNRRPDDEQGIPAVVRCLHEMRKNGSVESGGRGGQPEKARAG